MNRGDGLSVVISYQVLFPFHSDPVRSGTIRIYRRLSPRDNVNNNDPSIFFKLIMRLVIMLLDAENTYRLVLLWTFIVILNTSDKVNFYV